MRYQGIWLALTTLLVSTATQAAEKGSKKSAPPAAPAAVVAPAPATPAAPAPAVPAAPEVKATNLNDYSLEDLLNIKVTVASGSSSKGQTLRETPAIVSVVTAEDIRINGYRDLVDVLRMLPGFSIQTGADNSGTITPSLRGLKAGEGKMLLQINGFSLVDLSYVNVQVFNRIPIDQVKKIEVIRGPGSAIYGGNAELAVINITLKDGADLDGSLVHGAYGQMSKTYSRRNAGFAFGSKKEDLNFSVNSFWGEGNLGEADYTDESGDQYRYDKETQLTSRFLNVNATYKNLTTRFLYSQYKSQSTDDYYGPIPGSYDILFNNVAAIATYDLRLLEDDKLIITPQIDFNLNNAWNVPAESVRTYGFWNTDEFFKFRAMVTGLYKFSENVDFLAGVESSHYDSLFHQQTSTTTPIPPTDIKSDSLYYSNLGIFAQSTLKFGTTDLTFGARQESTTASNESALVPRASLTSILGDFHFKLLYSQAFRTPSNTQYYFKQVENLKPEKAEVKEIEVGYKITNSQFVTANIFDTLIKDALRYDSLGYANIGQVGSRGLEVEYKSIYGWGNLNASASYYEATKRDIGDQASTKDDKAFLAQPRLKATLQSTVNMGNDYHVSPSLVYQDMEFYQVNNASTSDAEKKMDPLFLANVYALKSNAFGHKGFDIGLGVNNIFDQKILYASTVNGSQPPPLPGPSREYTLKMAYHF